jgi:inorganic pyrophosphatase
LAGERADDPYGICAVVETPRGSRNKYAFDEEGGFFKLSLTLRSGLSWPCDFGFLPQTLAEDGDPLDVALLLDEPTFPGCVVQARLLGAITFLQDGVSNDRLVACSAPMEGTGLYTDDMHRLQDLPENVVRDLETFLQDYSRFQGTTMELTGRTQPADALKIVRNGVAAGQRGRSRR